MTRHINEFTVEGIVTRRVRMKETESGVSVFKFQIRQDWETDAGEVCSSHFTITAFGNDADDAFVKCDTGKHVMVTGKMRHEGNSVRETVGLIAREITWL